VTQPPDLSPLQAAPLPDEPSDARNSKPAFWSAALPLLALGLLEGLIARASDGDPRLALLGLIGFAIGVTLLGTNFGFSIAFRRAVEGDPVIFRAHAVMFALATIIIVPILAQGSVLGQAVEGFSNPIGPAFILGAAIFGIGMQMSGGCASGTLYLLGGGNAKFLAVLLAFILGSTIGAAHMGFWWSLPSLPPMTVFTIGPWPLGLALDLAGFAAVAWATLRFGWPEHDRIGWKQPIRESYSNCLNRDGLTEWVASTHSDPALGALPRRLLLGAIALALLNAATVLVAGRPWSETYGFALWGSKLAGELGWHPEDWAFWQDSPSLSGSIFIDKTSIMDMSIILGAFAAGSWSGRLTPQLGGSWRSWLAGAFGGLMMGYGARLSGGCNIGAYFSAIASGDFSGWIWAAAALTTTMIGVRARRWIESFRARGTDPSPIAP